MCLLIFIGLAYISPYLLLSWLLWIIILKPIINYRKQKKREREEELKRISKERLEKYRKEAPYLFASSSDNRSRKERPAPKSEPPRLVQPVSVDKPPAPDRLTGDCSEYVAEMDAIFAGWPWSEAWPDCPNDELYCQYRIKRAHEQDLIVLSYCPKDQSARIKGASGKIYAVSPNECDCDDFMYSGKKHQRPCKHIYKLALTLFHGFDEEIAICGRHTVLSDREAARQLKQTKKEREQERRRSALKRRSPHRRIITFLKKSGPVTRRDIVDRFSSLDEKEVQRAVKELYSVGLIQGEKRRGRYYHWVDDDSTV